MDVPSPAAVPELSDDAVRRVVELAALAPSVHNTQPWRFRWDGRTLAVLEDPTRSLEVLDPTGRERAISCGAAVLFARLALAEQGWDVEASTAPASGHPHTDDADVVARLTVTGRRTATAQESALAQAARRRATDRDPFDTRPLPDQVRAALADAAAAEGAWTRFLDEGQDDAVALQVLLSAAEQSQRSDPAYLEELAAWRRDAPAEGIPARALPTVPTSARGSSWTMRDFTGGASSPASSTPASSTPASGTAVAAADPPAAEHPTVLVLGTSGDDRADWVVAGQALGRLLLRGTVEGVAAQPLTQVLEVPVLRGRVRLALGVVGHPQMLLRLGYGRAGRTTERRPVEEVLSIVPPATGA